LSEKIQLQYIGNLRTISKHERSGKTLQTDAPIDNNGMGESFSPTDLVVAGLGSCVLTVMAIAIKKYDKDLGDVDLSAVKKMSENPRMISSIDIDIYFKSNFSNKEKTILERAAHTCPVHRTISNDVDIQIKFRYLD